MTQPTTPPPRQQPPRGYPYPYDPPPPRRNWPLIAGVVVLFLIFIGAVSGHSNSTGSSTPPGSTFQQTASVDAPPPPDQIPAPAEFSIAVRVLSKQCFGEAGCVVTYRIDPSYHGPTPLTERSSLTVVYEVTGSQDGPQINNFKIEGGSVSYPQQEFMQTPSSGTTLTAKVTSVSNG